MKKCLMMICLVGFVILSGCRNEGNKDVVSDGTTTEITEGENQGGSVYVKEEEVAEQKDLEEVQEESVEDYDTLLAEINSNPQYTYVMEGCEEANYGYYDVNNDGEDELVILTVRGITIFMYQDEKIEEVCRSPYSVLLENGMVWYHRPGAAPMHDYYQVFRLEETEYQRVCTFARYDDDGNGYYDDDGNGDKYFYNDEEISKHEWDEWIQPYIDCNEAVLHDTGMLYKE